VAITPAWSRTGRQWRRGEVPGADCVWVRTADPQALAREAAARGVGDDDLAHLRARATPLGRHKAHVEHLDGGGVLLVAPTLSYRDATDVLTGEVTCLALDGVVLTAETGQAGVLDRVAERLAHVQPHVDQASGGLLSGLLACLVEGAAEVEDMVADAVVSLEGLVYAPHEHPAVERLYGLKREIAEARRAIEPLAAELPDLLGDPDGSAPGDAWLRRLIDATDRLDRRLAQHDQLLSDMLSAHLALVSVAQNEQMRAISAWAATLAVPTLVGTIYGMNFVRMPELEWAFGYPAALGVMVVVGTVVNLLFRRSGWL
jgi:magnesium transporter